METHIIQQNILGLLIFMSKIDKNDKNKRRTIYKAINVHYFGEIEIFPRLFIDHYKKHPNDPQNIPS